MLLKSYLTWHYNCLNKKKKLESWKAHFEKIKFILSPTGIFFSEPAKIKEVIEKKTHNIGDGQDLLV